MFIANYPCMAQTYNMAFNKNMTAGAAAQRDMYFNDGVITNLTLGNYNSTGVGQMLLPATSTTLATNNLVVSSLNRDGIVNFNNSYALSTLLIGGVTYNYSSTGTCIDESKSTNAAAVSSCYVVGGSLSSTTTSVTYPTTVLNGGSDAYYGTVEPTGNMSKFFRLNSNLSGYSGNREIVMDVKRSKMLPYTNAICAEYLITGYSISTGSKSKPWIAKVGCEGFVFWSKLFTFSESNEVRVASMVESTAGEIYLCGLYKNGISTQDYGFIAKLTSTGTLVWVRKYGQTSIPGLFDRQSFKSILINQYGRIVVAGTKYWHPASLPNPSYSAAWVLEVDAATGATVTQNRLYSFATADCDSTPTAEYRNFIVANEIKEYNPQGTALDAYYISAVSRITDPDVTFFDHNIHHQNMLRINANTFNMNLNKVYERLFWTTISLDIRQTGSTTDGRVNFYSNGFTAVTDPMRYGYMYSLPMDLTGCLNFAYTNNTENFPADFSNADLLSTTTLTDLNMTTTIITGVVSTMQAGTQCLVARMHSPQAEEEPGNKPILISPNPSNGKYNITLNEQIDNTITVYDVNGNEVTANIDYTSIDISNQPNGIYFVRISNDKGTETVKIVKQ
jgi:hypothetical protein